MYFRCTSAVSAFFTMEENPVFFWHTRWEYKILCGVFMYIPAILFFIGVVFTVFTFNFYL